MTPLAALSVGSKIPRTAFEGVVNGVFDHACNIRLTDASLITCTVADYFDIPRGIRVKAGGGFRFNSLLAGGASAHCRGGILRIAESNLKIDLRDAAIWNHVFRPISRPSAHSIRRLWERASDQASFGIEFPAKNIAAFLTAQTPHLRGNMGTLVGRLIGRGPGLTPMGDDILTGLLAAPGLIAPARPSSRALAFQITRHLHATNDISRQMLSDAAQGLFIEPIVSVMSALYGNGCIDKSSHALWSVGGSSGGAMFMGLLAGVACVEDYRLQPTTDFPGEVKVA